MKAFDRAGGYCGHQGRIGIHAGDVLVLICRGPMGAGMEETYQLTGALRYLPFGKQVAVETPLKRASVTTATCLPNGRYRSADVS